MPRPPGQLGLRKTCWPQAPRLALDQVMSGAAPSRDWDPDPTPIQLCCLPAWLALLLGRADPAEPQSGLTDGAAGSAGWGWSQLSCALSRSPGREAELGHTHLSSPEDISSLNSELSLLPRESPLVTAEEEVRARPLRGLRDSRTLSSSRCLAFSDGNVALLLSTTLN